MIHFTFMDSVGESMFIRMRIYTCTPISLCRSSWVLVGFYYIAFSAWEFGAIGVPNSDEFTGRISYFRVRVGAPSVFKSFCLNLIPSTFN